MFCENCKEYNNLVYIEHEHVCEECGMVVRESRYELTTNYEENLNQNYFSNYNKKGDSLIYFKRRIRCIMGVQKIMIDKKILDQVSRLEIINEETVKNYLKENGLQKHYNNIPLIISLVKKEKITFNNYFEKDLTEIYKIFLNEYYSGSDKINNTQTPPVDFTCRMIIQRIVDFVKENQIKLPYDPMDYLKYFKDMKSFKKKNNEQVVGKCLDKLNFNALWYKYTFDYVQ